MSPVQAAGPVCTVARDMGLIAITAGAGDVIRLVPPLIVTEADIDQVRSLLVVLVLSPSEICCRSRSSVPAAAAIVVRYALDIL